MVEPARARGDPFDLAEELYVADKQLGGYADAVSGFWHAAIATHAQQFPRGTPDWTRAHSSS